MARRIDYLGTRITFLNKKIILKR